MDTDSIINTEEGKVLPRLEKKSRQALAKLGLKKVEGINRVVLRRPQGVLLIVAKPEVYKSAHSDCYIVFGDAKLEDPSTSGFGTQAIAAAQAAEARQKAEQERQAKSAASRTGGPIDPFEGVGEGAGSEAKKDEAEEDDGGDVDATGIEENDIETVIKQTQVSRSKAIKSLKKHEGDIINAIMECS